MADNPGREWITYGKNDHGIAGEAHELVYGARAATYGHPRFDFTSIGKVWTGLLQDLLRDDVKIDAYRVAVLMTGLKLARLVKSPGHHDSRVDTIGYMLTMERLDEPEEEPTALSSTDLGDDDEPELLTPESSMQTYVFPYKNYLDDTTLFQQKAITAFCYKEAKAIFDAWQEDRNKIADAGLGEPVLSPTETANPSDEEVQLALDILQRRQDFHDREATSLLAKGDKLN